MYCVRCGAELVENAKFCVACGTQAVEPNADPKPSDALGNPNAITTISTPAETRSNSNLRVVIFLLIAIPSAVFVWLYFGINKQEINRPQYAAGEKWTFIEHPLSPGIGEEIAVYEAKISANNEIRFLKKGGYFGDGEIREMLPGFVGKVPYPIRPDLVWHAIDVIPLLGSTRHDYSVGQWERVTVRAGTFNAIRVNSLMTYDKKGFSATKFEMWFSPETKSMLKIISDGTLVQELAEYSPR